MEHVHSVIEDDFDGVNRLIVERLHSGVSMVENIGHYIVDAGGKRLRPLITLLCARGLGYSGSQHIELATVIEFLHTATLLHDDVVDVSALRRGRATANAHWGNAPSVLVGDFIYSRAFQMLVALDNMAIMRLLSDTTNTIAEGEVEQLTRAGSPDTSEQAYLQVIIKKTAVLFAAAAEGAGIVAGASDESAARLNQFGLNLGIAFQLIDDVLDYDGDPAEMGKNLGDDLAEGKATLPLIYTMAQGTKSDTALVQDAIVNRDRDAFEPVIAAVRACDALQHTRQLADEYRLRAVEHLDVMPSTPFLDNLLAIASIAVARAA